MLVWSRGAPARLVGFFPGRIERRRYGVPLPVLTGWTHAYAPLGVPLVDRDGGEAIVAAWLDHVATSPELPKIVLLPYLPVDESVRADARRHSGAARRRGCLVRRA